MSQNNMSVQVRFSVALSLFPLEELPRGFQSRGPWGDGADAGERSTNENIVKPKSCPKSKSKIQVQNPGPKSKSKILNPKSKGKGLGLGLTL